MTRSVALMVALSALAVSGISSGHAQAPLGGVPPSGTIAPSSLYGAGPPVDGLDHNPYRDAQQMRKKSVAESGKARQSARGGGTKTSAPGTTN
jgi:hypothetical protein